MDRKVKLNDVGKMMRLTIIILLFAFSAMTVPAVAQSERKLVNDGNRMYKEKDYSDAEVNYKKALNINKDSKYAQFNLGDVYYKQENYEEAIKQFTQLTTNKNLTKEELQQAYHNLGNAYLQSEKYEESVKAYKNALKLNPKDEDTRYNLAYAQAKLKKEQQQNQQQQNQQNKQNQQQDKKEEKGNENEQQQNQQGKEEQAQQQQQKISKEDAEKILRALSNDEKNTQKKLLKKEEKRGKTEKNW